MSEQALFLATLGRDDRVSAVAEAAGWRVAHRSGAAAVVVIDARGATEEGLSAARELGGPIDARGDALLVLASRADVGRLAEFHAAGATHFLLDPFSDAELVETLRYAARHAERVGAWRGFGAALGEALRRRATDDPTLVLKRASDVAHTAPDAMAQGLAEAIATGAIEIRFQPQVAVGSRAITGVEALARWRHADQGEISAETLFATAERAGLVLALSEHVQALALAEAARWPGALSHLRLSINVTATDVGQSGFAETLLARIDASGFPRRRLTVEITESGLIENLGEAANILTELRIAGCRVAIDDFGTGYSSLAYLKALPLDYLKIDKKLTQDIAGSERDKVIVRGVIDMAHSLGFAVVAEGVETEHQFELLAKEGCQYYQGFLCAEPLDAAGLVALVERA